jgi:acyl carrier protein
LSLRALLTGGDKLHRVPDRDLPFTLVNHYGPTESTVVTTCATVAPDPEATSAPPIGRPISNTQVYVLDEYLQPVPVGVAGELFIGGDALARGYLNSPHLTAERFIPNPFNAEPGRRLYRTGDRVRYLPGGDIEYLERIDQQVKIRGFRIELGEIEAVLASHPSVRDAAVMARDDLGGGKRLVGYVAADWESGLTTDELVKYLRAKLPEYMIPNVYVKLDELPLTSSGKVDRRGLPSPDQTGLAFERVYVAPRTPTEETLADIFSKVLGVERVGIHDNFFEVGGHSLLATQLISRVRDAFRIEIPLKMFFAGASTVARLAEAVEEIQFREASEDEVAAMLKELDELSDEEVKALLAGEANELARDSNDG